MLNPHWKAYKATARRYEEERSKEQDPESSDSEKGDPYRFQGPRDGQPSPQTPTPYPFMPQGNYGNPSGEGHRVSEGWGKATPTGPTTPLNRSVHFQDPEETPRPSPRAPEALDYSEMRQRGEIAD